jgi:hypothetical protein
MLQTNRLLQALKLGSVSNLVKNLIVVHLLAGSLHQVALHVSLMDIGLLLRVFVHVGISFVTVLILLIYVFLIGVDLLFSVAPLFVRIIYSLLVNGKGVLVRRAVFNCRFLRQ